MVNLKTADILNIKIDLKILPLIIQEFSQLIGLSNALILVDNYKGTRMWVPLEFNPDHVLVKLIGHEASAKLIEAFGGELYVIPKCDDAMRAVRNELIAASDKSQSQLAREWNLTERQIINIQKNVKDDRQTDLF